jgi:rhodanese-related sulfurtransferase
MNRDEIQNIVKRTGTILIDVDPPPMMENGYPTGAINHPISVEQWEESLEKIIGRNYESIGIFSSIPVLGEYASALAVNYGLRVSFVFEGSIEEWKGLNLPSSKVRSINTEFLHDNLDEYEIIDVREGYELRSGSIKGAKNIPLGDIDRALYELSIKGKYAIVCAHGNRSREATKILSEFGFDASTVQGGISQWLLKKYDVVYL